MSSWRPAWGARGPRNLDSRLCATTARGGAAAKGVGAGGPPQDWIDQTGDYPHQRAQPPDRRPKPRQPSPRPPCRRQEEQAVGGGDGERDPGMEAEGGGRGGAVLPGGFHLDPEQLRSQDE